MYIWREPIFVRMLKFEGGSPNLLMCFNPLLTGLIFVPVPPLHAGNFPIVANGKDVQILNSLRNDAAPNTKGSIIPGFGSGVQVIQA